MDKISPTPRSIAWMTSSNVSHGVTTLLPPMQIGASKCASPINPTVENISYSMFMILVLLLSVSGNFIVILAVTLSNLLKRRSTFYFLASLACSDLFVTVFTVPFKISVKLHGMTFCLGLPACYVYVLADICGNVASILNLLLVSADRFVAIQLPYKYLDLLNLRAVKRLIIGAWCFSTAWTVLGIFNWNQDNNYATHHHHTLQFNTTHRNITYEPQMPQNGVQQQTMFSIQDVPLCTNTNTQYLIACFYGIYIPVLLLMTGAYVKILHIALMQIRKIKQHGEVKGVMTLLPVESKPLVNSDEDATTSNLQRKSVRLKRNKKNLRKELQATKSVAIVYLTFCVCWLPTCIITTISHIDEYHFLRLQQDNMVVFHIVYYVFIDILPLLNFVVNPIIYSFTNGQFRKGVVQLWRKLVRRSQRRQSLFELSSRGRAYTEESLQI